MVVYPKTINHIAVSVTNLDKAVKWYQEVIGFNVINGPVEIVADDSSLGMVVKDIEWFGLVQATKWVLKYLNI
jgi:catechol 2,3-dioxygenase-like lactoylglutathione lyase family enzyme